MLGLSRNKRHPPAGLDCGQTWTKLVGLRRSRKGITLQHIGRMPWTSQDREKPQHMASRLKALFSTLQVKAHSVITSLAGHSVIIKRLSLSAQQTNNLPDSLPALATEHIPFDIQDVCLDYQVLETGENAEPAPVFLVASKKNMVNEVQWIMSQAGLDVKVVDVDGFALCNCFEFNYPEIQDTTAALLDIGANQSTFCVVAGHRPLFIRDAGFGGQQITDRLAQKLDLPILQAETLKWQDPETLPLEIQARLERELQTAFLSWTEEIQRLLQYYANSLSSPVVQPQTLYLSGGGSLHPGLPEILREHLDFEITFLDPWRHCHIDDSRFDPGYLRSLGPHYAVAAGLALRGVM
ncbi:MAG: type IV pilus assembly protein PilM [Desulfovermiculus sp.]